jgi:hypothetical protein
LTKKDPNRRVFSVVEEIQEIKVKENAFLDESKHSSMTPEIKFKMDQKRKEIYVLYANLKPHLQFTDLPNLVAKFDTLKEQQKREIFKSLVLGQAKELAKASLYQNEVGSSSKVEESNTRAVKY